MSLEASIFLSAMLVSLVALFIATKDRWNWKKLILWFSVGVASLVAPQLTVVTSTSARSGVAILVKDAHAASVVPSEAAGHETTAARAASSNEP